MRDHPTSVMVFAAGLGTRMGALTADRPKPMIDVAGKPLIDHALEQVREFGELRTVVNLHYKPDAIRHHLSGSEVLFSEETPEILETGGGLRAALPLLGEGPVFTMNTDMVSIAMSHCPISAVQRKVPPASAAILQPPR